MDHLTLDGALQRLCVWRDAVDAEALQVLRDNWDEAAPILIGEIESAEPVDPKSGEWMAPLFFAAVYLCGEVGETRALDPLLDLCAEEGDENTFFQEIPSGELGTILARCSGGKPDRLIECFSDEANSDYGRVMAFRALLELMNSGRWPEEEFSPWFVREMESGEGKSEFLRSFLFAQGLYLVPEVARMAGVDYFKSGGNAGMGKVFDLEMRQIDQGLVLDRSMLSFPLDSADQGMEAVIEYRREDGEEDDFFDLVDNPEWLLEILEEENLKYEMLERPDVRRNALCPCGSGKKFKKCCINSDFLRVPTTLLSWKGTLIKDDDLLASKFMEAGFLHKEQGNELEVLATGMLFAELLKLKIHKGITRPEDVEAQGLFVGYEPVSAWILLLLSSVIGCLIRSDQTGLYAQEAVRWLIDQFVDAPVGIRKQMLLARALLDSLTDVRYDHGLADLRQILEWDPKHTVAALILAEHYQVHPSNPDQEAARQVLEARLAQGFEEEEERKLVQKHLDGLNRNDGDG